MPPGGRESRDDFKKRKEIEEARKAGTLPPEMDNEGNMINPHIPEYMSKAPWYLNQEEGAGLKHQRFALENQKYYDSLRVDKQRGFGFQAKRYRKGACRNCGSLTHKANECVEAPRRRGAALTGKNIRPDEIKSQPLSLTWDGKRDRWAGYDPSEHKKTIKMYRVAEQKRARQLKERRDKEGRNKNKKKKGEDMESNSDTDSDSDSDSDSDTDSDGNSDEELRIREHEEGQFESKHATRMKCSVRNLRIREDLPKYLRNLDPNSAHYDPKTRSMRANPTPGMDPDQLIYAGDNFVRLNGDSNKLAATQVFAWEAYSRGVDVNMQADPTTTAHMQKITKKRKEDLEQKKKSLIQDKYGDQDKYKAPDRSLLLGESEMMVKYTKDGRRADDGTGVAVVPMTKYTEDVFLHNHTCVWGSWYNVETRQWGYACCHLTIKQGYCTGAAGIEAQKKSASMLANSSMQQTSAVKPPAAAGGKSTVAEMNAGLAKRELYGYDETSKAEIDPEKLKIALKRAQGRRASHETDDRKRKYHSLKIDDDVTAEDMEAYRMTKMRKDDPMAQFIESTVDDAGGADSEGEDSDEGGVAAAAAAERRRRKQERKKKKKKKKKQRS